MTDGMTLDADVWRRPDGTIHVGEITDGSGLRLHRAGQTIPRERALALGIVRPAVETRIVTKDLDASSTIEATVTIDLATTSSSAPDLDAMSYRQLQAYAKRIEVAATGARDVLLQRIRDRLA